MASGDPVVQILAVIPPGADSATMDTRAGGSTPAENVTVYDFSAAETEYMDFLCKLEGYGSGGLTFTNPWSASSATSGQARLELAIRRMQDDVDDIDASHSYAFNGVSDSPASGSGELSYPTIAFTDGADMDSWSEGELAIVRFRRLHDHADDDMAGDLELWGGPLGLET